METIGEIAEEARNAAERQDFEEWAEKLSKSKPKNAEISERAYKMNAKVLDKYFREGKEIEK